MDYLKYPGLEAFTFHCVHQFLLPVLLLGVFLKIQQNLISQSARQSPFLELVDHHEDQIRISRVYPPLDGHVQLFPAEVAGEVVVRQYNQHLAAAVHAVRHVLDDGFSQLKVPDVNFVGYRVFVENRDQIFTDPFKVLRAVTDKQFVACHSLLRAACNE